MDYEKDKIRQLIEYKDKITQDNIKNSLEWILEAYNDSYINKQEYEFMEKEFSKMQRRYYDIEDEKSKLKERLDRIKHKYIAIRTLYRELEAKNKASCKKNKNMV